MKLIYGYSIPTHYKLSVLKNASFEHITYYTGEDVRDVSHLKFCILICNENSNFSLPDVQIIAVPNPQLFFYEISEFFKKDYLEKDMLLFHEASKSYIHKNAKIDPSVVIYPGCVIGSVQIGENTVIHANTVIYSDTEIGKGVIIESNSVIGAEGVMWVWNKNEKVKLHQLGNVIIENNVFIGSNVTIVRGSANESTLIGEGSMIAHGTQIGHGCQIGKNCHFANNVSLAGTVVTSNDCFFGSSSVVGSHIKINSPIILGANSYLSKSIDESGVYLGSPARKIKEIQESHHGVPTKKKI